MNIYMAFFMSGLLAVLTPLVIPYLIITSSIFEKLGNNSKQYKTNIFLFVFLTIAIFSSVMDPLLSMDLLNEMTNHLDVCYFIIHGSQIVFALWLFTTFNEKFQWMNRGYCQLLFRLFGIIIFSARLALSSLSAIGPIIGSLLVAKSTNSESGYESIAIFNFSLGLVIPFVVVLCLVAKKYDSLKLNKWWRIVQLILIGYLLLGSCVQLINLVYALTS